MEPAAPGDSHTIAGIFLQHNMDSSLSNDSFSKKKKTMLNDSNSSPSGEDEIPTEILFTEILARLPAESLMRFRRVCKSWCSLFREPSFVKSYYRHLPLRQDHTHLFLTTSCYSKRCQLFFSLQINQKGQMTEVTEPKHVLSLPASNFSFLKGTHSVNGLILISEPHSESQHVHIVNPCTREAITLPDPYAPMSPIHIYETGVHRLGFSELTNEYKVLRVHKTRKWLKLMMFTLGTRSWRALDLGDNLPFNPKTLDFSRQSVWLRGGTHWMHADENAIVVFDFRDEKFRAIQFPNPIPEGILEIIEVNGHVAVCMMKDNTPMGLWILQDYVNNIWDHMKVIEFRSSWDELGRPVPLGTIHTGDLVLSDSAGNVYLNNMKDDIWGHRHSNCLPNRAGVTRLLTSYDETIQPLTCMKYSV